MQNVTKETSTMWVVVGYTGVELETSSYREALEKYKYEKDHYGIATLIKKITETIEIVTIKIRFEA